MSRDISEKILGTDLEIIFPESLKSEYAHIFQNNVEQADCIYQLLGIEASAENDAAIEDRVNFPTLTAAGYKKSTLSLK